MKTRIIGAVLALILAGAGAVALVGYVRGADARAQQGAVLTDVYIIEKDVPQGTPGDKISEYVESGTVPERNLVPDAVTDLAKLEGLIASADLLAGEQLTTARFASPAELADSGSVPVPDGMQKLSFTLPADRVVGGEVKAGDYIGMISTADPAEVGEEEDVLNPQTRFAFHNVLVTRVQGVTKPDGDDKSAEQETGSRIMVTIALSAHDAERWVWFAEGDNEADEMGHAQMWLTLENPSTDNSGTGWITGENAW